MFLTSYFISITVLAVASVKAATDCSQPPTSFQIYSNATGLYGQPGGPCSGSLACGIFFSAAAADATTYYTIDKHTHLVTAPESPSKVAGRIAYTASYTSGINHGSFVDFGRAPAVRADTNLRILEFCSIVDSPDGDGTCNLVCNQPHLDNGNNFVKPHNAAQWGIGLPQGGEVSIQVKVVF